MQKWIEKERYAIEFAPPQLGGAGEIGLDDSVMFFKVEIFHFELERI